MRVLVAMCARTSLNGATVTTALVQLDSYVNGMAAVVSTIKYQYQLSVSIININYQYAPVLLCVLGMNTSAPRTREPYKHRVAHGQVEIASLHLAQNSGTVPLWTLHVGTLWVPFVGYFVSVPDGWISAPKSLVVKP